MALQQDPVSRSLQLDRALLMERQGLAAEAHAELERLARESGDAPSLLVHLARALRFAGRGAEARSRIEAALRRWPADPGLHRALAQLRWDAGDGVAAVAALERAIVDYPRELPLRLVAADVLRAVGDAPRALELLEGGLALAPGSVAFLTSAGVVLDTLDRPHEALPYLRAAAGQAGDRGVAAHNLIAVLLRTGAAEEALRLSNELTSASPADQQLIAYRATALRMLGDGEYTRLYDYQRLVRVYEPSAPAGFADLAAFNAMFARELMALHRATHRPLAQSLRGGTQTERNLPRDHPVVAAFFAMIDAPIRDYIARLDISCDHPTDRRKSAGYRIAGSWSVSLAPGGFHLDHVHPQGWLSSAYYVELPGEMDANSRAGWLKFGEPGMRLPGLGPQHFVRPRPGALVLFPSYMWHGTVPFEGDGRRLTAAFDVVPA